MSERITRNLMVARLGSPDRTEGSLNDPVERAEHGIDFNEKWLYRHPHNDPAGAANRMVYWHRYDFVATLVRMLGDTEWRTDPALAEWLANGADRLALIDSQHTASPGNANYRPASEVRDALDLGGYIEGQED